MAPSQWTTLKNTLAWASTAAASSAALPDLDLLSSSEDVNSTSSPSSISSIERHPITPPQHLKEERMQTTSPIDIATPSRNASSSPSSQGPKAIKYHGIEDSKTSAMMTGGGLDPNMGRNRQDSFAGAKPISMNNPNRGADGRPRRESLAGSLVGGMSWGGVSVGSWVRDDIIMAGTSPFPYQSPSYHSSSYLPKLEAQFMRDFSCCGATLPTLHDLLHHYEECHAQQTPRTGTSSAQQARNGQHDSKAHAAKAANTVQQQAQQQKQQQLQGSQTTPIRTGQPATGQSALTGGIQRMLQQQQSQPATPVQQMAQPVAVVTDDMDGVEDMEMDDVPMDTAPETTPISSQRPAQAQQSLFGQPQRPNLHLTNTNGMIHQGLRSSQPNTPSAAGFGFQNNPTVSSVNTPTLSTQSVQQHQYQNDDSIPGSPAEPDDDFNQMAMNMNLGNMNLNNMNGMGNMNFGGFGNLGFGNGMNLDLCIDEPAKRLYSPNGFGSQRALQQQFNSNFGASNGQMGMGTDQEALRQLRQAHMLQQMQMQAMGVGNMGGMMMMGEENKPFKCPVMGCEKAYKNQNGLKYHKTHGHQNQQLHENGDGTFSIVNPETSAPYPGTLGMEKEKPYKCDMCGKRYKNLNGLKYHKSHSPPCNPDLKLNDHLQAAGLVGMNMSSGLPGIGEEL